jgi:hypothetical protein
MSYPHDAPAAAWYPDPQMAGRVRWWDGTNWTEHVSVPANPMQSDQIAIEAHVPQIAEADAALAAADAEHAAADPGVQQGYIGRHAAGANPAPRQAPRVPQIRPRQRTEALGGSLLSA